jgi:uncharacterized membrane protein YeaQ/YmgE (transglycosylase-associated protein family)
MSLPSILFGLVISTLYGAIFHLWKDGGLGRLFLYLILGWAGFWLGQFLAERMGWTFASLGSLHLGLATAGSVLFLAVGYWLSLVQIEPK